MTVRIMDRLTGQRKWNKVPWRSWFFSSIVPPYITQKRLDNIEPNTSSGDFAHIFFSGKSGKEKES